MILRPFYSPHFRGQVSLLPRLAPPVSNLRLTASTGWTILGDIHPDMSSYYSEEGAR
jgi:hypothetical protein